MTDETDWPKFAQSVLDGNVDEHLPDYLREPEVIPLPRYMIGTTATHVMGDLSRSGETIDSMCLLRRYDPGAHEYIGEWETGFGFIDVRFPADTVRELTENELGELDQKVFAINDSVYPGSVGARVRETNSKGVRP